MGEKPIIFSTPMVQAILRNEKSMTRRIIKGHKNHDYLWERGWVDPNGMMSGSPCLKVPYKHKVDPWEEDGEQPIIRLWPKHQVGDLLWLKEGVVTHASIPQVVGYVADGCKVTEHWEKLRNALFMPKWAARIWLEVTGVKVERIQDISPDDALAPGPIHTELRACQCGHKVRFTLHCKEAEGATFKRSITACKCQQYGWETYDFVDSGRSFVWEVEDL